MTDESAKIKLEVRACGSRGTPLHTWSTSASWRLLAALSWVNRDLRSSLEQGSEPGVGTCRGEDQAWVNGVAPGDPDQAPAGGQGSQSGKAPGSLAQGFTRSH